ncbi:MAG: capsular polysaccharide export protein [Sphingomonadales bacterium]|nr:capsular polysaccharide export protein [Sphingomonadales bacterium]
MVLSSASILLPGKEEIQSGGSGRSAATTIMKFSPETRLSSHLRQPFLRIPSFPGAGLKYFARMDGPAANGEAVAADLKRLRVGGAFWGAQPALPNEYVLAASAMAVARAKRIAQGRPVVRWDRREGPAAVRGLVVSGECDPWHMLANASALVAEAGDELHIVASLLGCLTIEVDQANGEDHLATFDLRDTLAEEFGGAVFENPFSGEAMDAHEAIALCGFWRELIDSNRDVVGGVGFAFWKQRHVAPLLWGGGEPFKFLRSASSAHSGSPIAVWRAKVPGECAAELERAGAALIEVEDGFLRSRGLGADCIPPLSITVDRLGAHFDPSRESELERLLDKGKFGEPLLDRARDLRHLIVEAGLGKYDRGHLALDRLAGDRCHILVPGQVEDDRAVTLGGCGLVSNLELLKRVREQARHAYILYKPHPDVVAGHRRGTIPQSACLEFADEIVGDVPISSLIAMVDEVHVNTSLAGFEALLREKRVTTYGVPFYAGWGLTTDLGPVPARRTARRTLDELVAATLLLYPRYFDPVTGLPCPAEVVVARLSDGEPPVAGLVVGLRRLQGKLLRRLRSMVQ